jgi:hypothetical protein
MHSVLGENMEISESVITCGEGEFQCLPQRMLKNLGIFMTC